VWLAGGSGGGGCAWGILAGAGRRLSGLLRQAAHALLYRGIGMRDAACVQWQPRPVATRSLLPLPPRRAVPTIILSRSTFALFSRCPLPLLPLLPRTRRCA